ncbi:MAG: sugar phosphate isomerase/epimerase family protein [Desulfococcaceae bacterium]
MKKLRKIIHVCVPFRILQEQGADLFLREQIQPEIGINAQVLDSVPISEFARIAEQFRAHDLGITMHGPFIDMSPGSDDAAVRTLTRQRFEQVLKLIPVFRPETVVCHAGYDEKRYGFFREIWMEHSLVLWNWFGRCLRNEGSRLMLENVYEHGPEQMLPLFEQLTDAGFCLDMGHCKAFSCSSLECWLNALGKFIGQLHLHDNFGNFDNHLAPGKGILDFPLLFRWLKEHRDRPPVVTMETHREKDIFPGLAYLENIWPWD